SSPNSGPCVTQSGSVGGAIGGNSSPPHTGASSCCGAPCQPGCCGGQPGCRKPPGGDIGCCGKPPDDGRWEGGGHGGCRVSHCGTACVASASGEYFGVGSAGGVRTTCVASGLSDCPAFDTNWVESASPGCWGCCAGLTICVASALVPASSPGGATAEDST